MSLYDKTWFKWGWLGIVLMVAVSICTFFIVSSFGWSTVRLFLDFTASVDPLYFYRAVIFWSLLSLSLLFLSIKAWLRKQNHLTLTCTMLTAWFLCNVPGLVFLLATVHIAYGSIGFGSTPN